MLPPVSTLGLLHKKFLMFKEEFIELSNSPWARCPKMGVLVSFGGDKAILVYSKTCVPRLSF